MGRAALPLAALLLTNAAFVGPVVAQGAVTLRVTSATVVMENPRGDSLVLTTVQAGTVLEVLARRGSWYRVKAPADSPSGTWREGWVQERRVDLMGKLEEGAASARARAVSIRAFTQLGGVRFTAADSFETVLGSAFGAVYGAGGQLVFRDRLYAQVGVDRYRETGARVLVSDGQVFDLGTPVTVSVTPLQLTLGYRDSGAKVASYLGAGVAWHKLEEEASSPPESGGVSQRVSERHLGYHVVGGLEVRLLSWVWLAGEVQWAYVPDALGAAGVSAVLDEKDLGGATVRLKLAFGY